MLQRHSRLPTDVLLPSQNNHSALYPEYANEWEDQMRQAYQAGKNHSEARKKKNINRHYTKVILANILKLDNSVSKKPVWKRNWEAKKSLRRKDQ